MTLTRQQSEALEASIKHWEENLAAESPHQASTRGDACALCTEFYNKYDEDCSGCPVKGNTGEDLCMHTPWFDANTAYLHWSYSRKGRKNWRIKAKAELDFLKSLRDPE